MGPLSELDFLKLLRDHILILMQKISIKDDLIEALAMIDDRIADISRP